MNTYKFLPPDRISYLRDGLLRITQPSDLNDPFECIPIISLKESRHILDQYIRDTEAGILDDILNGGLPRKEDWEAFQRRKVELQEEMKSNPTKMQDYFFQRAERQINAAIGILCLAKKWDSTLMWSHYSLSHRGFCVGFDRNHGFFRGEEASGGLRDVTYAKSRIKVPIRRGESIDFEVMFAKSVDWKYEQEERMLFLLENSKKVIDVEPYKIHLVEVPRDAISEIVVGARASPQVRKEIETFCSANQVKMFRAVPSSSSYDMLRIEDIGITAPNPEPQADG